MCILVAVGPDKTYDPFDHFGRQGGELMEQKSTQRAGGARQELEHDQLCEPDLRKKTTYDGHSVRPGGGRSDLIEGFGRQRRG